MIKWYAKGEYHMKRLKILNVILIIIAVISTTGFVVLWVHGEYTTKVLNKFGIINEQVEVPGSLLSSTVKLKNDSNEVLNYLAIGNSITIHQINEYWWGEWGMAATKQDSDYFHVLSNLLNKKNVVYGTAINFSCWEVIYYDRAETLSLLDSYLTEDLNLVTIQLGENITDTSTLENDYIEMIKYIQEKSPSAKIFLIGQFWADNEKDTAKINACDFRNTYFVSLEDIQSEEYKIGIGANVNGDDGKSHTVEHDGVATHPNDLAMEYIANTIYTAYDQTN